MGSAPMSERAAIARPSKLLRISTPVVQSETEILGANVSTRAFPRVGRALGRQTQAAG